MVRPRSAVARLSLCEKDRLPIQAALPLIAALALVCWWAIFAIGKSIWGALP